MKPLVLYCRWQRAKLLLHGRSEDAVWGEIKRTDGQGVPFHYKLKTYRLDLELGGSTQSWQLDEAGVAKPIEGRSADSPP